MPNILILGAGGYVAQPLAQSLVRSGNYSVFGLVRRQEQAKLLTQNEIFPIVADAGSTEVWSKVIEEHDIDVIVDCASAYEHAGAILDTIVAAAKKRREILQKEGFATPKLGFVYVRIHTERYKSGAELFPPRPPEPGSTALPASA